MCVGMRCMDRLPTLPFKPLCILAMKIDIAHIAMWVCQNLCVGKTLWDKTLTQDKGVPRLKFNIPGQISFYCELTGCGNYVPDMEIISE
jgi:hypothetical protein